MKMLKEAIVLGMVKTQRMQIISKQMEKTQKGIWLKVQACFEAVWGSMGTGQNKATAEEGPGDPSKWGTGDSTGKKG